ncbi:unnamed protein product [Effrenium voratum]|uniref:Uncharacterized protein n=1 Tax=Effrenium voratum TaxID=2562239 RepID=A0AA36JCN4_9DINO|nr:unnamed protein product [Effrenium voratum]
MLGAAHHQNYALQCGCWSKTCHWSCKGLGSAVGLGFLSTSRRSGERRHQPRHPSAGSCSCDALQDVQRAARAAEREAAPPKPPSGRRPRKGQELRTGAPCEQGLQVGFGALRRGIDLELESDGGVGGEYMGCCLQEKDGNFCAFLPWLGTLGDASESRASHDYA